jgi:hypothetical protein
MKHLKKYGEQSEVNESFWNSIFGKPTVKDAAHDSLRGQGHSHMGKDDSDENYVVFKGQKFYPDQIQYDDAYSTKEIPRIEDGILIVANPAWSM